MEGKVEKKKTTAKFGSSGGLIRAENKINYQVLMYAFDESFKSPSCWSNATSTEINTGKDGATCKNPALVCNVQQDSARIVIL